MIRKIVKIGSSLAVTLPKEIVDLFKLKAGDDMDVSVHPQTGAVILRGGTPYLEDGKVSPRFKRWAADLRRRRAKLYTELAK